MNESASSMLLIGIGTSGCSIARSVADSFGESLRYILADTDAKSGDLGGPFTLIGSNRLSGTAEGTSRGSGMTRTFQGCVERGGRTGRTHGVPSVGPYCV